MSEEGEVREITMDDDFRYFSNTVLIILLESYKIESVKFGRKRDPFLEFEKTIVFNSKF